MPSKRSVLSIHINRPGVEAVEFVAEAKPAYVVVLLPGCHYSFIRDLKQASPTTRIAGRHFGGGALERPNETVEEYWGALTNYRAVQERLIEDIFGPNEFNTTQGDNIYKLIAIDRELGSRFRDQNYRYWMFSTSERQPPDVDDWNWTRDIRFRECAEIAAGYCVHAYWWPTYGASGDPLRHQRWWAKLPPHLQKPVLLKECGPDAGVVGQRHKGWFTAYGGDPHKAMADFAKYDTHLRRDSATVAAHIFAFDFNDSLWWDFAVQRQGFLKLLAAHVKQPHTDPFTFTATDKRESLTRHPTKSYNRRLIRAIDTIVIHHTAMTSQPTTENLANAFVNRYNWPGMAYHFYITPDGTVDWCLYLEEEGAHCYGHNAHTMGVCLDGLFTGDRKPTAAQILSATRLVEELKSQIPSIKYIKGHRELGKTACPGEGGMELVRSFAPVPPAPDLEQRIRELEAQLAEIQQAGIELKGSIKVKAEEIKRKIEEITALVD